MSRSYKKFFIATLIIIFPLILLLCLSGKVGVASLFLHVKTLVSVGFVMLGIFIAYKWKTLDKLALFCILAMIMGMLGDIFLELNNKLENVSVLSGLVMFLVQHIIWCTGMIICASGSSRIKRLFITMPLSAIGVSLFIIFLVNFVGASLGSMAVPVFIYGIILTWAFTIPLTIREKKDIRLLILAIAGILFFISDALLVKGLFGGGMPTILSVLNLLTYYYAQYLIALSTGITNKAIQ